MSGIKLIKLVKHKLTENALKSEKYRPEIGVKESNAAVRVLTVRLLAAVRLGDWLDVY